ncbi:HAD-IC family P-type ATPase, partial [Microbacteriaceae bacterium K1510]|nr:HAD-IC family P-type ATPase [Microbacteriaceae bacterium K1510]
SGRGYEPKGEISSGRGKSVALHSDVNLLNLIRIAERCNNASLISDEQTERKMLVLTKTAQTWRVLGDPTEGALLVVAKKAKQTHNGKRGQIQTAERIDELPFDSDRKMMSIVDRTSDGKLTLLTKGAVEAILQRCSHILWKGETVALTQRMRMQILERTEEMAANALRVLGFAYRTLNQYKPGQPPSALESNLVFVGMAGMIDPPREEVKQAISLCRQAGIKTVMITGDHKITAEAIAREIGILRGGAEVVQGQELSGMSDEELVQHADRIAVYARVSPEHKLRIIRALQSRGHIVAMTGDGVNDAPAIKSADIGIAMGITGTDVTKE